MSQPSQWQRPPSALEPTLSLNVSLPLNLNNGYASEVIGEALRLFEAYRNRREASLLALRSEIEQGIADIEAGKIREVDIESVKQRGRSRLAKHAKSA